ncbi:MAG: phosphotransferase [Sphingobium sp.]
MTTDTLTRAKIAHSVVDAAFLASEVARRYDVKGPVTGLLLYRGMNDVYIIQTADTRYALRVWRKDYRDVDEVAYELDFLDYLRERKFPASAPIRDKDGGLYFKLDAPEGPRAVALYDWAAGVKFGNALNIDTAHRIGANFAKFHLLGLDYAGPKHVFTTDNAVRFQVTVPALLEFTYDRPDDHRDYEIIGRTLVERLREVQGDDMPLGICHCDFHPSNIHVEEDGNMTFLDFDGLGEDYLMQDVQNYVWGNLFYNFDPAYGEAFEAGYDSVRPFTRRENESKDLFLLAKAFRLVAGMAHSSNSVGRGTLRFQGMDWLSDYIKSRARPLGLL